MARGSAVDHRSFAWWPTGLQPRALACCAALVLSACADGYPTEDVVGLNATEMSQPQRLSAMNELGQDAHPDSTWIYRAMPGCSLQWTVHDADAVTQTVHLPLPELGIQIRFDKVDRIYNVQVRPPEASKLEELTILQSTRWVDAIEMRLLLRWFQISCTGNGKLMPSDSASPS